MYAEIATTIALALIAFVLIVTIIFQLANLGWYFTLPPQGTTTFINAGDSMREILPNIGGYKLSEIPDIDGQHWLVPTDNADTQAEALFCKSMIGTRRLQKTLWNKFGVKFISWFWPHVHVHSFDLRKGGRRRVENRTDVSANAPLRSRIVDSPEKETVVSSLLFLVPRPVYVEAVELAGDNSRINLLVLPVFRQVIPALPVYNLKGDFFTLLDAAIEAALVDFFAKHRENNEPLTYQSWLRLAKAGEESPLEETLRRINISASYYEKLKALRGNDNELVRYIDLLPGDIAQLPEKVAKQIPSGIIPRFGFALISFRVVEWEPHESSKALADAIQGKETAVHAAEAQVTQARGERDAMIAKAEGQAARYRQPVKALVEENVDPNLAANVLLSDIRTQNIGSKDSHVVTYVEGGASASVMIPAPTKGD